MPYYDEVNDAQSLERASRLAIKSHAGKSVAMTLGRRALELADRGEPQALEAVPREWRATVIQQPPQRPEEQGRGRRAPGRGHRPPLRLPGQALGPEHLRGAADPPRTRRGRKGQHHQARHERHQPQGVEVHSFRQPSEEELNHDFPWRYQRALPERGRIGTFNRSHYEEVLVVRVHPELLTAEHLPKPARGRGVWKRRYQQINAWEEYLVDDGIGVVKVFLNLSRREQARRFIKRIDEPEKNWKFAVSDIREREHWDEYQKAFNTMLNRTSTEWAPWHVVPADHKWFTRLATAAILVRTLAEINPRYPRVAPETLDAMAEARAGLLGGGACNPCPQRITACRASTPRSSTDRRVRCAPRQRRSGSSSIQRPTFARRSRACVRPAHDETGAIRSYERDGSTSPAVRVMRKLVHVRLRRARRVLVRA